MNFAAMGADFDFVAKGHRKPSFSMYAPKVCENAENSCLESAIGAYAVFYFSMSRLACKNGT